MRRFIKSLPVIGPLAAKLKSRLSSKETVAYWETRYANGGNSGSGSYGRLAAFKAAVINGFVEEYQVASVIEFGCGDGHQLSLAQYGRYIGLDVSASAVAQCSERFKADGTKSFFLYHSNCFVDRAKIFRAELAMSLDVLFHIIEDDLFHAYMTQLFDAAERYVIIYASDYDAPRNAHEKRRSFSHWVAANEPGWHLQKMIKNSYPYDSSNPEETSSSDFYFYARK